jgi:hypothetical protein
MAKKNPEIEPTPEDWENVRRSIANAREILMGRLAQHEARRRIEAEREAHRRDRRSRVFRRLFSFRRAA